MRAYLTAGCVSLLAYVLPLQWIAALTMLIRTTEKLKKKTEIFYMPKFQPLVSFINNVFLLGAPHVLIIIIIYKLLCITDLRDSTNQSGPSEARSRF